MNVQLKINILSLLNRVPATVWLILVGLGIFATWLHARDAAIRAQVRLEAVSDSLARVRVAQTEMDAVRARIDAERVALADSITKKASVDSARAIEQAKRAAVWKARAHEAEIRFATILPDSLKPEFETLQRIRDQHVTALQAQLATQDSVMARLRVALDLSRSRIAPRDSTITALNLLVNGLQVQLDKTERAMRPGLLTRSVRMAPWLVAVLGVGIVIGNGL